MGVVLLRSMDLRTGLDAALLRRQAEHAERAAEAREARQREETRKPAVEFGGALSHLNEVEDAESVDPVAIADRARVEIGRALDVKA